MEKIKCLYKSTCLCERLAEVGEFSAFVGVGEVHAVIEVGDIFEVGEACLAGVPKVQE